MFIMEMVHSICSMKIPGKALFTRTNTELVAMTVTGSFRVDEP